MILVLNFIVSIMGQSDCEPKYTNLYPKQQQIANLNISNVISGFNYSLINPPNEITLPQSGQLLFNETIKEDIEQVLFASILQTAGESSFYMEQIASLVQINKTSYQVLVVQKYYNQTYSSQVYSIFNSDNQCLSITQMNADFMIINCLSNQLVTIYQGDVQISILPNITSNKYNSQIQISRYFNYLFVIFPFNLNESYIFQINISSTNIVEYTMISQTVYPGVIYTTVYHEGNQICINLQYLEFLLTSQQLAAIPIYDIYYLTIQSSINLTDCHYFNIYQDVVQFENFILNIMILCQNSIKQYHYKYEFTLIGDIFQPLMLKPQQIYNYIPLQINTQYMIVQYENHYLIYNYDMNWNLINFNPINNQSVFILINPLFPTYYILSTTDQQILSLQKPMLVINQIEQQLSNTTIQISLYISLNMSCQINLNIIPCTDNQMIFQRNSTKLFPSQTTSSFPVIIDLNEYFIGSKISFSTLNNQNMLSSQVLDFYLINQTNSNSIYNQFIDSEVIFIQSLLYTQSTYQVFLQYKNLTFMRIYCDIQNQYIQYSKIFIQCQNIYGIYIMQTEQVQQVLMINENYFCVRSNTSIAYSYQSNLVGTLNFTVENPVIYMQSLGALLVVMYKDIVSVFNTNYGLNQTIYNITNITPTQIITNQYLFGPILFVNNQTQLLIYYCSRTEAYLIKSIDISILNSTIIIAEEYLYISNSTMQQTYYIYNFNSIQLISQEQNNYTGLFYFNPDIKFYCLVSSDNILSILQNSGQNNQLFKSIQLNSSIEQVSLTYVDRFIVINYLQNQQVFTYIIDQYQTLFLIPEKSNNDYFIVNYSINASNEFSSSILSSQLLIINSGIYISDKQQDPQQLYLTSDKQIFTLDPTFIQGQITNYEFNCLECQNCSVTQQYQQIYQNLYNCGGPYGIQAMAYISNQNVIALSSVYLIIFFNLLQQTCDQYVEFPVGYYCLDIYYFSNLNVLVLFQQIFTQQYLISIVFSNSQYQSYNISQTLTNIEVVDQFNAAFIQGYNTISLYQVTVSEPVFEQVITTQSQIVCYTVGGITYNDANYMVLMYLNEDQDLFINVFSVINSKNYYNYSLMNTTSISISNLLEKYSFEGGDVKQMQIYQIIMNNQYILSMQTIISTKYFYSYSVNINLLIGSPDQITAQLNCLIPPYGNWGKLNQIDGNNQTLIFVYMQDTQYLAALYDLNQCQNQSTLNFSVGIPYIYDFGMNYQNLLYVPMLLYSAQPNADLFQSTLATIVVVLEIDDPQITNFEIQFYNFSKEIEITIESSNNMTKNQSVYLIASNNFMQQNVTLYLIQAVALAVHIMAWWAWLLISLAIILVVGATSFLLIKKKKLKEEQQLLEMK